MKLRAQSAADMRREETAPLVCFDCALAPAGLRFITKNCVRRCARHLSLAESGLEDALGDAGDGCAGRRRGKSRFLG